MHQPVKQDIVVERIGALLIHLFRTKKITPTLGGKIIPEAAFRGISGITPFLMWSMYERYQTVTRKTLPFLFVVDKQALLNVKATTHNDVVNIRVWEFLAHEVFNQWIFSIEPTSDEQSVTLPFDEWYIDFHQSAQENKLPFVQ